MNRILLELAAALACVLLTVGIGLWFFLELTGGY